MNSVGVGIARRWDAVGITRTSGRSGLGVFLAVLLMAAAPGSAEAEQRMAQLAGTPASPPPQRSQETHEDPGGSGEGFVVLVSSQRSEEAAQAAYSALQSRHPTLLAERPPIIKRADLGDHGVYYRTVVGPFDSAEEATKFCNRLRAGGGACVIQRNCPSPAGLCRYR
jgi:cell division septation protein DedD